MILYYLMLKKKYLQVRQDGRYMSQDTHISLNIEDIDNLQSDKWTQQNWYCYLNRMPAYRCAFALY